MEKRKVKYSEAIGLFWDFPQPGILFRDISPLLQDVKLREEAFHEMAAYYFENNISVDVVAGIDSRGFIFGTGIATRLQVPFVMVRKPSKLPGKTISIDYGLEYGKNTLVMQVGSIKPGQRVLVVDDLLATGGSANAAIHLIQQQKGEVVGACFAIELEGLGGRQKLAPVDVFSLLTYPAGGEPIKQEDGADSGQEQKQEINQAQVDAQMKDVNEEAGVEKEVKKEEKETEEKKVEQEREGEEDDGKDGADERKVEQKEEKKEEKKERTEREGREDDFLEPGLLVDNDLELVLTHKHPANTVNEWVPMYSFAMRVRAEHAGAVRFRVGRTYSLEHFAGHIGYEVSNDFRGNHLAERSVRLLMPFMRRHGMDTVWITCNPTNGASRRTCERLGAKLVEIIKLPPESDMYLEGEREKCRYRLDLV